MESARKPEFWVDELWEEHECGGYGIDSLPKRLQIAHDGRRFTLISPFARDSSHVASVTRSNPAFLHLIAKDRAPTRNRPASGS